MSKLKSKIVAASWLYFFAPIVIAQNTIKKPSWVKDVDSAKLEQAGLSLNQWILVFMAVIIALSCIRPGYFFIVGESEKGIATAKDILIGAVISVVFGAIVFGVISQIS